ncbi:MAG: DNA translocase FtsK [Lachnospiraceae bacterium]|nr:DNA translocase FtsK [Lachnospiraceae bacterium]
MAQTKKNNSGRKTGSSGRKTTSSGSRNNQRSRQQSAPMDAAIRSEIVLIALFAVAVFLFLCNFGIIGVVGNAISDVMFGIFGLPAYIVPILLFIMIAFGWVNSGNVIAMRKMIAGVVLFLVIGILCELITGAPARAESYDMKQIYTACSENHNGGGVIAGSLAYLCYHFMGMIGTILMLLVAAVISVVVVTEKSFVSGVKKGGRKVYERSKEDAAYRRERARVRREEMEEDRRRREEEKRLKQEAKEDEKILRMDKKVSGVMLYTSLTAKAEEVVKTRDDIHEINLTDFEEEEVQVQEAQPLKQTGSEAADDEYAFQFDHIRINSAYIEETESHDEMAEITDLFRQDDSMLQQSDYVQYEEPVTVKSAYEEPAYQSEDYAEPVQTQENVFRAEPERVRPVARVAKEQPHTGSVTKAQEETKVPAMQMPAKQPVKKYVFPPINKLIKGTGKAGDSTLELKQTAQRLQQTLQTFGVRVTITDISQGPAVTRYELQPEQGVKVSKIVGLTDDIKLNLAATDIRIEAPIPGKAAVGIEVPNKENTAVALRDLIESKEFKEFPSNLAFAVGKDIGGKTVVADIAKMPHMLIAGATGSGKSVCINTLIMSILYKAHPDDVKLIMVDPKVVELSVYNGIPHLLIPVVTDPKKASAALQWGVAEMTDRYQKFADFGVRDLKGYNKQLETMKERGEENIPAKMPQIVIIVDELADLMMVAPGEVEESICRLAQLARAAGIHLIIATQRPSVDVITGLIKANMPSRVAFSVSSGVDSRTILDMNGAEKLLGKGDMLFYPQGYSKPARVQGAFVSDKEVSDVVEFLKNQTLGNIYDTDLQEKIASMKSGTGADGSGDSGSEKDQYFVEAARFIIEKDKASIGMLQRVFKIGFNRAARIMDQLCEAGVVGEEEGTKPRKVLMSEEQFEQYIEECL